jgi:hypothetical protein
MTDERERDEAFNKWYKENHPDWEPRILEIDIAEVIGLSRDKIGIRPELLRERLREAFVAALNLPMEGGKALDFEAWREENRQIFSLYTNEEIEMKRAERDQHYLNRLLRAAWRAAQSSLLAEIRKLIDEKIRFWTARMTENKSAENMAVRAAVGALEDLRQTISNRR